MVIVGVAYCRNRMRRCRRYIGTKVLIGRKWYLEVSSPGSCSMTNPVAIVGVGECRDDPTEVTDWLPRCKLAAPGDIGDAIAKRGGRILSDGGRSFADPKPSTAAQCTSEHQA